MQSVFLVWRRLASKHLVNSDHSRLAQLLSHQSMLYLSHIPCLGLSLSRERSWKLQVGLSRSWICFLPSAMTLSTQPRASSPPPGHTTCRLTMGRWWCSRWGIFQGPHQSGGWVVRIRWWDTFVLGSWDAKSTGGQSNFRHSSIQGFNFSLYSLILLSLW